MSTTKKERNRQSFKLSKTCVVDSENYYRKIRELNINHYSGEVPYYSNAPVREVEKSLLASLLPKESVLDVACGSGRFSLAAAKHGCEIVGIDITHQAIVAAIKRTDALGLANTRFVVGDMTELPFNENQFRYVVCPRFSINAVATLPRRKRAINEMVRVTRPGGKIFIESFNKFYLGRGLGMPLKNVLRDIIRHAKLFLCQSKGIKYDGLLPGDIVYDSNKVPGAPRGYAHLPTIFELMKLTNHFDSREFYSIPQIIDETTIDPLKFFRYAIWVVIKKCSV